MAKSKNFSFDYDGILFSVSYAAENLDNWRVKKSQIFEYSKEKEIVAAFENSFTNIKLLGDSIDEKYDFLTKVCNRSSRMLEWLSNQKLLFSELAQVPSYLKDRITSSEFSTVKDKISSINKVISDYSLIRSKASEDYRSRLSQIDRKMKEDLDKIKANDKVIKILSLTSQSLPLSIAAAVEEYNMKTDSTDFEEKKSLLVREFLIEFKISLLDLIKQYPDIDIDKLLDEISLK